VGNGELGAPAGPRRKPFAPSRLDPSLFSQVHTDREKQPLSKSSEPNDNSDLDCITTLVPNAEI
jgi:hypothetical protein